MNSVNGKSSVRSTSKAYPISAEISEYVLLICIGAVGVLMHAYLRTPLKMPGHQGLIYMALLLSGRIISKKPFASSLSSLGAATMLLFPLGFMDPFIPFYYFLPGIVVDILFPFANRFKIKLLLVSAICGLAFATIPLMRILIGTVTGFDYGIFAKGFLFTITSHFVFGFLGGALSLGIFKIFRK